MKLSRALAFSAILGCVGLTPAFAVDVIYSTTGTFSSCSAGFTCAGSTLNGANNLKVVFAGTAADPVANVEVPDASYAPFGTFTTTGPNAGATDSGNPIANFTLTVNQTAPDSGNQMLVGKVSGTIRIANSTITVVDFSGTPVAVASTDPLNGAPAMMFSFGSTEYWVDTTTPINPQTRGGTPGITTINGAIDTTVPEPTFYAITGLSFMGLLAVVARRRRQNAQLS